MQHRRSVAFGLFVGMVVVSVAALAAAWLAGAFERERAEVLAPLVLEEAPPPRSAPPPLAELAARAPSAVESAPLASPVPREPEPARALLVAQCVGQEDDALLAGLRVVLRVFGPATRDVTTQTDEQGRFELVVEPPLASDERGVLSIEGGDRASERRLIERWPSGARRDLGVLRLARGVALRGRIVDAEGAPIVTAGILVGRDAASADAEGRFAFAGTLPLGAHHALAQAPGYAIVQRTIHVPEDDGVEIVLLRAQTISGRVVDLLERPIAGVAVHADHTNFPRVGTSEEDGRFEIVDVVGTAKDTELHVLGGATVAWRSGTRHPWGARDLVVRLERALGFDLEVVDRESGAAIEDYAIHVLTDQRPSKGSLRDAGMHPGGKLRVGNVTRGTWKLWVVPAGEEHAPAERVPVILVDEHAAPVRVELERRALLQVEVVDAAGQAIPSAVVQLVRAPLGRPLHPLDVPKVDDGGLHRSEADFACRITAVTCDARGRATLRAVPRRGQVFSGAAKDRGGVVFPKLHLVASAAGWTRTTVEALDAAADSGEPQRIVMQRGGRLEGQVVPVGALALEPQLFLAAPGNPYEVQVRALGAPPEMLALDAEGRFVVEGLFPGSYLLRAILGGERESREVASCVVEEGATTEVVVDLSASMPATLSAQVANLPHGARFHISRIEERKGSRNAHGIKHPGLDAEGNLAAFSLLPGTYELFLWLVEAPGALPSLRSQLLRRVELRSGEQLHLELSYRPRRLEVVARGADGSLPKLRSDACALEGSVRHEPAIGADGVLVFDPGPTSAFYLLLDGMRYPSGSESYEPPPGDEAWKLEVVLRR